MEPGGLWDSGPMEIRAWVTKDGEKVDDVEMAYAGEASRFETTLKALEAGVYEVTVIAFDPRNGNAGLDHTTFIVR